MNVIIMRERFFSDNSFLDTGNSELSFHYVWQWRTVGNIIFKTPNFFEFLHNPLYIAHPLPNLCGGGQELVFVCPVDVLLWIEGPLGGRGRLLAAGVSSGAGVTTAKMTQHDPIRLASLKNDYRLNF